MPSAIDQNISCGLAALEAHNFKQASKQFAAAMKRVVEPDEKMEVLTLQGDLEMRKKNYVSALHIFTESLRFSEESFGKENYNVAAAHSNLAACCESMNKHDQAAYHLSEAERLVAAAPEQIKVPLLRSIAAIYKIRRNYDKAIEFAKSAYETGKQCGEPDKSQAYTLQGYAEMLRTAGRHEDADELLRNAIRNDEPFAMPEDDYLRLSASLL
jgi:tetratricopeptide (TPR) repeat protein